MKDPAHEIKGIGIQYDARTGGPEDVPPCEGLYWVKFINPASRIWTWISTNQEFRIGSSWLALGDIEKWHGPLAPPEGF